MRCSKDNWSYNDLVVKVQSSNVLEYVGRKEKN